ncbi:alpha-N-arabinofuranosidase [Pseudonocardia sp. CA-107938]|uniref:arabinosylfuranosidase ArfA n=1 Tax=Pseudonocardia sp. CA-107938 TaxID=3240021 RepID=UPI003D901266
MLRSTVTIDPALALAEIDPRLYGSFVEHMGRCVYTGIHEPGHATADELGFRGDVAELVGELGVPIVRYPGGNFVSGYNWEDGIGPVADRPVRLDLAWRSIETNQVGLHEFAAWAKRVGTEPMMAVNLGTRGVDEARRLVEYCNHPGGTELSDLRRKNGAEEPFGIKVWCLGNELDGPWQIGHKTAYEYGRLALEAGKVMRWVDPSIELVACGSSNRRMPTFGSWEATILEECYDTVDYLSLHSYSEERKGDRDSFLASGVELDNFIEEAIATCDYVRAKGRHRKRLSLSVDEWNVWYLTRYHEQPPQDWAHAPRLIEDTYSVVDAVVVGDLLISLLNHADRVRIGCLAQLVNVIAPIRTEPGGPAWRQTTYHPFALTSANGRGTVLRLAPSAPTHETSWLGEVPLLDAAAVVRPDGSVAVFAVNRSQTEPMALDLDVRPLERAGAGWVADHVALCDDDPEAVNSADQPDRVTPHTRESVAADGGTAQVVLPPLSWNLITLRKAG